MTDLTSCAQDLVLAIFRLAVCDYVGVSYGHDGPDRRRRVLPIGREQAAVFLQSPWACFLGEIAGVSAPKVWTMARERAGALALDQKPFEVAATPTEAAATLTRLAA